MMKRKWPALLLVASTASLLVAAACSLTGPDAGPRMNGCISAECFDGAVLPSNDSGPKTDGGDGGGGFPNPLEGTTKTATLVKGGFNFLEGPVWIGGHLLFSDTNASPTVIYQLEANGTTTVFRQPANGANGNAVDPMGRLVTAEGKTRLIVRSAAMVNATKTTLVSAFGGLPFNSPNDVIVRSDGNIYFTDPDYGADPDAATPRQPGQSIFRIDPKNAVTKVKQYTTEPNGAALSPDGNTLYVADTTGNFVNSWTLAADGTPSNEGKFADVMEPDGLAVDDAGNLYIAAAAGIVVFDKTGTGIGTITVPEVPANCTFGGADRKTLYITARTGLYQIKLNVPGLP